MSPGGVWGVPTAGMAAERGRVACLTNAARGRCGGAVRGGGVVDAACDGVGGTGGRLLAVLQWEQALIWQGWG